MAESLTRGFAADDLKKDVRERIEEGTLEPGSPISSISNLADRYEIAYGTARKAVQELVEEGILTSQWGKGTFVAPDPGSGAAEAHELLALSYSLQHYPAVVHRLQEEVTQAGGMLTLHNTREDNQNPELERQFLESVRSMGFKGVGLFACPVPPLNTELYHELRAEGIKVALLSAHQYDVSQETVFLPNHNRGGYLAVEELYARGVRHFVYVGARDFAVYKDWIAEGARRAALQLGAAYTELRDGVNLDVNDPTVSGRPVREWMQALRPSTAILATAASRAALLEKVRTRLSSALKEEIHVVSCGCDPEPLCRDIPRIEYDVPALLEGTVEYLADDDIDPQLVVHKWCQPVFVPGSREDDDQAQNNG